MKMKAICSIYASLLCVLLASWKTEASTTTRRETLELLKAAPETNQ